MTRYLPDSDLLMIQFLNAELPGINHGTQIPADLAENLPFITVKTLGDKPLHPKLGGQFRAVIQCWSDSRKTAADTAESVRVALYEAVSSGTEYAAGHFSFQECTALPSEVPNTTPDQQPAQSLYRFQATYRLVVRTN